VPDWLAVLLGGLTGIGIGTVLVLLYWWLTELR
jgi:hypothetical protein